MPRLCSPASAFSSVLSPFFSLSLGNVFALNRVLLAKFVPRMLVGSNGREAGKVRVQGSTKERVTQNQKRERGNARGRRPIDGL
jgi:hypothetical protein